MREAGVAWARADFDWGGVEPRDGEWTFGHLDETVEWAGAAGVDILPILDYSAGWASPAHERLDAWTNYVVTVVSRYAGRLKHWEVWNEENLAQFWPSPSPTNYARLLEATYRAVKAVDTNLVVLLGGTAGIPREYLESLYRLGAAGHFDVMNVHPYRWPRRPEDGLFDELTSLRALMAKYGDGGKPVWITEIGWPTHRRECGEDQQARYLARAYLSALQARVERVFWYEFQAVEGNADDPEHHFGIVHRDLSPKPAYRAYAALTRARPAGSERLEGAWRDGEFHFPAWRRPDGRIACALWTSGPTAKRRVAWEGRVEESFRIDGTAVDPAALSAEFDVTGDPLYIVGARVSIPAAP